MVVVYTGNGKGKTSAALGLLLRSLGYGKHIAVIQFVKKTGEIGEIKTIRRFFKDHVDFLQIGEGFYNLPGDDHSQEEHRRAASLALEKARECLRSKKYFAVILDEVNVAADMKLINEDELIDLIKEQTQTHLVLTGRNAGSRLINVADLVTEMKEIKHPFQLGKKAVKGIDY